MSKEFKFNINAEAVAAQVQQDVESIYKELQDGVKSLTAQTHAKVLEFASQDLKGYNLKAFMGENGKNVSWDQVSDNIFVVAIDPSVGFYNDGRPPVSMATESWLLKNAKTAKDGSKYRVIPFKHDTKQTHGANAQLNSMAKNMIRQARTPDNKRIPLYSIEKNADGTPRIGTLHKIKATPPFTQSQAPSLFSKPRSAEDAKATGLKAHGGIFKLEGLAVSQRMVGPKVKREAVTFRVVSSKHQAEGRWLFPAIPAHRFLERAFEWATQTAWPEILSKIGKK